MCGHGLSRALCVRRPELGPHLLLLILSMFQLGAQRCGQGLLSQWLTGLEERPGLLLLCCASYCGLTLGPQASAEVQFPIMMAILGCQHDYIWNELKPNDWAHQ